MINIYLTFNIHHFPFFQKNSLFQKHNINMNSSFKKASIVFFLMNTGNIKLLLPKWDNFRNTRKFDNKNEINLINHFIINNKKVIIYLRSDGSSIFPCINNLIKKYPNKILVLRDFMLKKNKIYPTINNSYIKYLMNLNLQNTNKIIRYVHNYFLNIVCFTIPNNKKIAYGFIGKKYQKEKKNKIYDIFYVKNYRENQLNCELRKKTLEKIIKLKKKYTIFNDNCPKDIFREKILQSKIYISTWGLGESLRDDYFCLKNDTIVLKINTCEVRDFYKLYKKYNVFHFYKHDLSDLEEKIDNILNNYDYYYKLYNKKRKEIIKKYNEKFHAKYLCDNIKKYLI